MKGICKRFAGVKALNDVQLALRAGEIHALFISHRMDEVFDRCDRVTILRDGTFVTSAPIGEMTRL